MDKYLTKILSQDISRVFSSINVVWSDFVVLYCVPDIMIPVMETLDSPELLMEDQVWLDYLWDFKTRGINLDFSSIILFPGLDTN